MLFNIRLNFQVCEKCTLTTSRLQHSPKEDGSVRKFSMYSQENLEHTLQLNMKGV